MKNRNKFVKQQLREMFRMGCMNAADFALMRSIERYEPCVELGDEPFDGMYDDEVWIETYDFYIYGYAEFEHVLKSYGYKGFVSISRWSGETERLVKMIEHGWKIAGTRIATRGVGTSFEQKLYGLWIEF